MAIEIKPENKGLLSKKVGKKSLTSPALSKTIAPAKKSGNVKLDKPTFKPNKKAPHLG